MIEQFREHRFNLKSTNLLMKANKIIEEYESLDISITIRQLYYRLVSRGFIPNTVRDYQNTVSLMTNARYAGLVDWLAIEDRVRLPRVPDDWGNLVDLLGDAKRWYRLKRWDDQDDFVALLTEKDALASVLYPIADEYHIPFYVNRGYTSASMIYRLSKKVLANIQKDKNVILLYLGDHDPSGLDMVRDIQDRLYELTYNSEFTLKHVALTKEQIEKHEPPPNPAKFTDSRFRGYVAEHGRTCWEVDALPPEVMIQVVKDAIEPYVDHEKMKNIMMKEEIDKERLQDIIDDLEDDTTQ